MNAYARHEVPRSRSGSTPAASLWTVWAVISALLAAGCDALNFPVEDFFIEQTATVATRSIEPEPGRVTIGDEGVVCVSSEPGDKVITIPLDNPAALDIVGLVSGTWPPGVQVTARQSTEKNTLVVTITGAHKGQEIPLGLTLKTAKEGRLLEERDLNIVCVDFETRLAELTVPGQTFSFSPDVPEYVINDVPSSAITVAYVQVNPDAVISISGGTTVDPETGRVELAIGTNRVTVRVQAAHGAASREYTLHVTRSPSGAAKSITAFTLAGVTVTQEDSSGRGRIDEAAGTISIIVPYDADLTSLSPAITHTGVSVSPASGEARDFSVPVVYTVTAGNESARTYTVTVAKAEIISIAITRLPLKTVYLTGETLDTSGMVIQGMDSAGISIDITSGCSAGTLDSGAPGMKYVTMTHSASGKTADLLVMVQMNSKEITSFTLAERPGTISHDDEVSGTITVILPYSAGLSGLTPRVVHNGTGIDKSGAQDFTNPVAYTVSAEDGTARTYTVRVTRAEIASIAITAWPKTSYKAGETFDPAGMVVTGLDSIGTSKDITSECDLGTLDSSTPGTKEITITHTPSGETTKLMVTVQLVMVEISSFTLAGKRGDITDKADGTTETITVVLPYNVSRNSLTPVIEHNGVSIEPSSAQNFTSPVTYTVTASSGETRAYTVTVTNAELDSIAVTTAPAKTLYGLETAANVGFNPAGMVILGIDSQGNAINGLTGFTCNGYDFTTTGSKTVTITHNASGTSTSYTVEVRDFSLLSALTVFGIAFAFDPAVSDYTLPDQPDTVSSLTITAAAAETDPVPAITGAGSRALAMGTNTLSIKVSPAAGYGAARTYTITVSRGLLVPTWTTVTTGNQSINLNWNPVAGSGVTYDLYLSTSKTPAPIETTPPTYTGITAASHSVSGVAVGYKYVWVRAVKGGLEGDWSDMKALVVGRSYTDAELKTAVETGGTVYIAPGTYSFGSGWQIRNVTTTIIPGTGTVSIENTQGPGSDSSLIDITAASNRIATLNLGGEEFCDNYLILDNKGISGFRVIRGAYSPDLIRTVINIQEGVTIQGGNTTSSLSDSGGGGIWAGGSLNMYGGAIMNNHAAYNGGGVRVTGTNAGFYMQGGTIAGNSAGTGGGIFVGAVFSADGGIITGNTGGGVYCDWSGQIPWNNATITGNTPYDVLR
jgi:hypothetical protein